MTISLQGKGKIYIYIYKNNLIDQQCFLLIIIVTKAYVKYMQYTKAMQSEHLPNLISSQINNSVIIIYSNCQCQKCIAVGRLRGLNQTSTMENSSL